MTGATTTIPFSALKFIDHIPRPSLLQERFTKKLREIRMDLNSREPDRVKGNTQSFYDLHSDAETTRFKRRIMRYLERLNNSTGIKCLARRGEATLTPLRDGLPIARIMTEHEVDEFAAALHYKMPWMTPATAVVRHCMRASVREGRPGLRLHPLVLIVLPGIGKSFWAAALRIISRCRSRLLMPRVPLLDKAE